MIKYYAPCYLLGLWEQPQTNVVTEIHLQCIMSKKGMYSLQQRNEIVLVDDVDECKEMSKVLMSLHNLVTFHMLTYWIPTPFDSVVKKLTPIDKGDLGD